MALLLLRHALIMAAAGTDEDTTTFFTVRVSLSLYSRNRLCLAIDFLVLGGLTKMGRFLGKYGEFSYCWARIPEDFVGMVLNFPVLVFFCSSFS